MVFSNEGRRTFHHDGHGPKPVPTHVFPEVARSCSSSRLIDGPFTRSLPS